VKALFLIPSAYGFATFSVAFLLYQLNLIGYLHPASDAYLLCLFALAAFACSAAVNMGRFRRIAAGLSNWTLHASVTQRGIVSWALFALHLVGLYGIYKYVVELIGYFGSASELFVTLGAASYKIRQASDEIQTIGTQLSYLGWIAIWITAYQAGRGSSKRVLWALAIVQLAANLIYIDRTRPVWIVFGAALTIIAARYHKVSPVRLARTLIVSGVVLVSIFVAVGTWIGKITLESSRSNARSALPVAMEPLYLYGTSGFAYFDQVVAVELPHGGIPQRMLYPALMIAGRLGLVERPPPQINEFKNVPMPTNVGTFLEPLYRDAGIVGVLVGTLLISFGGDALAMYLLRRPSAGAFVGWAALCFVDFIAFFTPKASSTPTWLFLLFGVAFAWRNRVPIEMRASTGRLQDCRGTS
jgi:oligosaccharide repeat unit polymerase